MKRSARWYGLFSAVVLAITTLSVKAADKVETLFPADTDMVMSFNIEQILASDLMKKYALDHVKTMLKNNELKQVFGTLGLDPLSDFSRVYISGAIDFTEQKFLMIAEGKFDAKKINTTAEDFLGKSGELQSEKVGGKTAYKFTPPNAPNAMYGMVVDNKYLAVGSDKEYLAGVTKAVGGSGKSLLAPEMNNLLSKTDPKASMFMVANLKKKLSKVPGVPNDAREKLEAIEFMAAELNVEKTVRLNLALGVADEETATQMADQIKQGLQLAKAFLPIPPNDPRYKPVMDTVTGIKVTGKGKVITISAEATTALIDAMLQGDK